MKATILLSTFAALAPATFAQDAPTIIPATPLTPAAPAAMSDAEQALANFVNDLSAMVTALESATDKDSADKAAAEVTQLMQKLHAAQNSGILENIDQEIGMKYLGPIMEASMRVEPIMKRIIDADFYGSESLKQIIKAMGGPQQDNMSEEVEVEIEEVEAA